jgi:hypothetical protein
MSELAFPISVDWLIGPQIGQILWQNRTDVFFGQHRD